MKTVVIPIAVLALMSAPVFAADDTMPSSSNATGSAPGTAPTRTFKQLDTDGNGRVTEEEYAAGSMDRPFMSYDKNGDGRITEDEYRSQDRNRTSKERMQ